jgi:alkylation response protein AidB-like acyl-CoA dehydrogenase
MRGALQIATQYAPQREVFGHARWATTRASSGWWRHGGHAGIRRAAWSTATALRYDAGDPDAGSARVDRQDAGHRPVHARHGRRLQVLGGNGYLKAFPMERFMRDAKMNQIGEGTSEIHKNLIGRHVLQQAQALPQHPCLDLEPDLLRERGRGMTLPHDP